MLSVPVSSGPVLQMNPSTGGTATLPYGGTEFSVLVTFQLPVLSAGLNNFYSVVLFQTQSAVGGATGQDTFFLSVSATCTGGNSGIVTSFLQYRQFTTDATTVITYASAPMVSMPMLVGGWVTVGFSLSAAGVATLSVRDIFAANNATAGAFVVRRGCSRVFLPALRSPV